jgi:hypothetical protein
LGVDLIWCLPQLPALLMSTRCGGSGGVSCSGSGGCGGGGGGGGSGGNALVVVVVAVAAAVAAVVVEAACVQFALSVWMGKNSWTHCKKK